MNPLKVLCFLASIFAIAHANSNQNFKPTSWFSSNDLENLPAVDQISLEQLENMPAAQGAQLATRLYHLAKINHEMTPTFVPSAENIPAYIMQPNGEKITTTMKSLISTLKQQTNFGKDEVTIIVTGLPSQKSQIVKKAINKLVQCYLARYNRLSQEQQQQQFNNGNQRTSSEEGEQDLWKSSGRPTTGNVIIIDLGSILTKFSRFALLDVEKTGSMLGGVILQLTTELDVPREIIHVVAQGIGAHVAGVAGRKFQRLTSHKLPRITALDPSKIYASHSHTVFGLGRGDAKFVDAIHTSTDGLGTRRRVGNVDFYPNGPASTMPGTDNVVESSMRATRYYAESVLRGNERNFPAVAANSLQQLKQNNVNGPRVNMGYATNRDVEGDYMLEVNANSPFGRRASAQKQSSRHSTHQYQKSSDYDY